MWEPHNLEIVKFLQRGTFGEVKLAKRKDNNQEIAIKRLCKNQELVYGLKLDDEIEIVESLNHPNIIKFHHVAESDIYLYHVMEYYPYGDFFDVREKYKFDNDLTLKYGRKLKKILDYLRSHEIIHRDIKAENIMLKSDYKTAEIVLIDFGHATRINENTKYIMCGTPGYIAPEMILQKKYDYNVDLWSLGVLMFETIGEKAAFNGNNSSEIYKSILGLDYEFNDKFTDSSKKIIQRLLSHMPSYRYFDF